MLETLFHVFNFILIISGTILIFVLAIREGYVKSKKYRWKHFPITIALLCVSILGSFSTCMAAEYLWTENVSMSTIHEGEINEEKNTLIGTEKSFGFANSYYYDNRNYETIVVQTKFVVPGIEKTKKIENKKADKMYLNFLVKNKIVN